MTKRERLEDLGVLACLLNDILDKEIFAYTDNKHGFELWKERVHDKEEYGMINGLQGIFMSLRMVKERIQKCQEIANGDYDEH